MFICVCVCVCQNVLFFNLFPIFHRISNKGHPNIFIMIFYISVITAIIIMKFHGNREKHVCLSYCCGRVSVCESREI